jgi:hypothetical protein
VVRQTFPKCHAVMIEAAEHNLMQYFHSVGLLRLFCACLFEYWHEDVRPDLLALVVRAARLGHQLEAVRTELSSELKMVHASTSWRLTKPLRSLVDNLKRLRRGPFAGR